MWICIGTCWRIWKNLLYNGKGLSGNDIFKPDPLKKHLPQNPVLFSMDSSAGDVFFLFLPLLWTIYFLTAPFFRRFTMLYACFSTAQVLLYINHLSNPLHWSYGSVGSRISKGGHSVYGMPGGNSQLI